MAGESSRYLLQIDIDWSQGKRSTDEFLAAVQARIAELEALAGKTRAQGGLNPTQVGQNLGEIELALQRVKAEAATVNLPGVNEALVKLQALESLLKTGKAFSFTGYSSPEQIGAAKAKLESAFRSTVNAGLSPGSDEGEKQSPADAARKAASDLRVLAADDDYIAATVELATARKTLSANTTAALVSDELYIQETVRAAATKLELATAERATMAADEAYLAATVEDATARNALAAIERGMLANDELYLESTVLAAESKRLLSAVENETFAVSSSYLASLVRDETAKNNLAAIENETFAASGSYLASVKRAKSALDARTIAEGGTPSGGASATTPEKRGGFLGGLTGFGGGDIGAGFGQRLASSAAFFASGTIIFTAINELRQSSEAAQKLQIQLSIIRSQLAEVGDTGSAAFEQINAKILDVSKNTGVAADQVALVSRRLAGVFADEQGTPNFTKGLSEAQDAFKLAAVTGLPTKEITDDLVAISTAFDKSFKDIGDLSIGLGQQFGQSEADIIQFTAALAPTAQALGFTAEQLAGLGAVAQEFSGQSGASLAENFRRILPSLQQNQTKIFDVFAGAGDGKTVDALIKDFAQNNIPAVIKDLVEGYKNLNPQQQNLLGSIAGGRREAGAFFTILEHGDATLRGLGTTTAQYAGDLDKRFNEVKDTVSFAFKQMNRALEEFAITLFQSGIGDALTDIAHVGGLIFEVASKLLSVFGALNDATHGLAGELAGLYITFRALSAIWEKMILLRTVGLFGGLLRGGGAASVAETGGGAAGAGGGLAFAEGAVIGNVGPRISTAAGALLKNSSYGNFGLTAIGSGAGLSGAGGIGAGLTSFIAVAAPFVAFIALNKLYSTIQGMGKEIGSAQDNLRTSVIEKLKSGATPDQIRAQIPAGSNLTAPEAFISFLTGQGTDNPRDVVDQVINKYQVDATQQYLKQQVAILKDYFNKLSPADKASFSYVNRGPEADPKSFDQEIQTALDEVLGHPEDPARKSALDTLINSVKGTNIPEIVKQKIQNSQDEALKILDALGKEAGAATTASDLDQSIAIAQAALASGSGSSQLLIDKLRQQDKFLDEAIKQGIIAGNDISAIMQQRANNARLLSAQIVGNFDQKAGLDAVLAELQGQDSPQATIAQAKERAALFLANPDVASADKIKAATDLAKAEQAAFQRQVDDAKTLGEKLALVNNGFEFSREAQVGLAQAELLVQSNADTLTSVASDIGLTVGELDNLVANTMVDFGVDAATAVKGIIQAKIDIIFEKQRLDLQLAKLRGLTGQVGGSLGLGISESADKLASDIAKSDQIDAAPPPSKGGVNNATKNALQQQAISSAKDDANARLDIEVARANGDAIRLAQIAKERAAISAQFAVTNAEKLAAFAEAINADNAAVKAQQEYNVALRDLVNAQNNDDPVVVARNALDSANEAVANASGPIAEANAQAAAIRAQHAVANAIQDLADGQTNILIAMAEAAGDSVEAARLKLKELTDRLANAGALGLNQGDKDKLTAEIINQTAAVTQTIISEGESQIQTDLTLKRITKAQAIAELEALRAKAISAHASQKEIDQISIEIQNLKGQLGQDFKFNLPAILGLPTLYEVRRLGQSNGTAGGSYNDNRIVTINITAQTNATPQSIAGAVAGIIGPANQFSTYSNKY